MTFETDAAEHSLVSVPTLVGGVATPGSPVQPCFDTQTREPRTASSQSFLTSAARVSNVGCSEPTANSHEMQPNATGPNASGTRGVTPVGTTIPDGKAQQEGNRGVLAQVLYSALRHGASATELRESFRGALLDAVRRIRNEDGLTVNQAARDYGVRRNDLASTDVDDQLDVAVLRVAMQVVTLVQRQGDKTPNGFEMTNERIRAALDAEKDGPWTTLSRTYPRDAFRSVIDRVLKSSGAFEPGPGRVAVQAKSFFPAIKLSEAIPFAHFSVSEYVHVVSAVVDEMKTVAYRAGLRLGQSPRTRDAAYASLSIRWNGDACSLVDALRELAQGASDEGESLTVVVCARKS